MTSATFFQDVSGALVGFLPPQLRGYSRRLSTYNLKVWFGEQREHYEVQMLRKGKNLALEVGFHSEHSDAKRNDEVIGGLIAAEKRWRKQLGKTAEAGDFVGPAKTWRRISEFWLDGEWALDTETAVEAAERLATYIRALEPLRS